MWEQELDIYGRQRKRPSAFIPFKYQGQYEDAETGLYYNRFRYYDPNAGSYISQDPIGCWEIILHCMGMFQIAILI
uniref:RHS repeat domain-containing protein n=1 Tax=Prevotella aurantiaca TaxID=596085 RepID=UPI00278BF42B|nr:RHS repeat-associated core domain-containing protein [Prevotella aurantiaca]